MINTDNKMIDYDFEVVSLRPLTFDVYEMTLSGEGAKEITCPGQFINIAIDGKFLRRPISVCDKFLDEIRIVFKVVGSGTEKLSKMQTGDHLRALSGLGNGFDVSKAGQNPLIMGGGVGVPPLYMLAKEIVASGIKPNVVLGFNTASEVILEDDFIALGCNVTVTTVDGSYGVKGFVTDALPWGNMELNDVASTNKCSFFYTCGPEPMLRAVYSVTGGRSNKGGLPGEFSFESRMGCGFGACMGCSCKTITGYKRICKGGPVLDKEEILWDN